MRQHSGDRRIGGIAVPRRPDANRPSGRVRMWQLGKGTELSCDTRRCEAILHSGVARLRRRIRRPPGVFPCHPARGATLGIDVRFRPDLMPRPVPIGGRCNRITRKPGFHMRAPRSTTRSPDRLQPRLHDGIVKQRIRRPGQAAAPVRVLLHRIRKIGLFLKAQHIFQRQQHERAGRAGHMLERRVHHRPGCLRR